MEDYLGKKYVQVSHENYDEFLIFMGYNYIARKAAMTLKPVYMLILNEDGTYTLNCTSLLVNWPITFQSGVEFTETRPDRVKLKTIVKIEGNILHQVQIEKSGREYTHVHEFFPDKMIVTSTVNGFDKVMKRTFHLVK